MTDREIVQKDIKELYLGNLGTVEFDLSLPQRGKYGSEITWQSDNLNFMNHEGRVSRPAYGRGNREVHLTAVFRFGGWEESRVYTVTVLEEGNAIEVDEIFPIVCSAVCAEQIYLPCAAAVRTKEGRVISHFIEWDDGAARCWDEPGRYEICGHLRDTAIPVTGYVQVRGSGEAAKGTEPQEQVRDCADAVTLLYGSDFYDAQERVHAYLSGTDPDQWLYSFRQAAGLSVKGAEPMTGWDAPEGLLRGHSTGHYLSALALCFRATRDEQIRQKAVYMVDALKECQDAFAGKEGYREGFLSAYSEEQFDLLEKLVPYPKIWAPYYTLHKILAGLLDLDRIAGIRKAGVIAEGIGSWVCARLGRLTHEKRVQMWSIYIAGEYGGMNESMAELYRRTGKEEYLQAAGWFDNDRLFFPLEQDADALDGMHANQHIPQMVGAMKMYEAAGAERYYTMAERFWKNVTSSHMYSIGGTGESEMFHEPGNIAGLLTASTSESCATYNMLKLTARLFAYRPDKAYMDYCERAAYNHILSSCDHEPTGGSTYFLSMRPKARKDFDLTENSCCHGTGLESHFKYGEYIYFVNDEGVYVNLFIPSRLWMPEEGIKIVLDAKREDPGSFCMKIEAMGNRKLYIRRPYWADGTYTVTADGDACCVREQNGYLVIDETWGGEVQIQVTFFCSLRYEPAPDQKNCVCAAYGPYVLAALTDSPERLALRLENAEDDFERDQSVPLKFWHKESGVCFVPFERVWKEAYQVYLCRTCEAIPQV